MIQHFKKWLAESFANPQQEQQQLKTDLATAVLYCEVIRADQNLEDAEAVLIQNLLKSQFNLNEEQAIALVDKSHDQAEHANDLVSFTRLINEQNDAEQKQHILENMWRLALADGHLDVHEEHIIRRISELMYIPHSVYIQSKLKVLDS